MTRGLNKLLLIGNVGKDPEMKYTQQGTPVTAFTLAVNRNGKAGEGQVTWSGSGSSHGRGSPNSATSTYAKGAGSTSRGGSRPESGAARTARCTRRSR
jgi:hypothetical protein